MKTFKFVRGNDVRVVAIEGGRCFPSFNILMNKVTSLWPDLKVRTGSTEVLDKAKSTVTSNGSGNGFSLVYRDFEGDVVTVVDDESVVACITLSANRSRSRIRLDVIESPGDSAQVAGTNATGDRQSRRIWTAWRPTCARRGFGGSSGCRREGTLVPLLLLALGATIHAFGFPLFFIILMCITFCHCHSSWGWDTVTAEDHTGPEHDSSFHRRSTRSPQPGCLHRYGWISQYPAAFIDPPAVTVPMRYFRSFAFPFVDTSVIFTRTVNNNGTDVSGHNVPDSENTARARTVVNKVKEKIEKKSKQQVPQQISKIVRDQSQNHSHATDESSLIDPKEMSAKNYGKAAAGVFVAAPRAMSAAGVTKPLSVAVAVRSDVSPPVSSYRRVDESAPVKTHHIASSRGIGTGNKSSLNRDETTGIGGSDVDSLSEDGVLVDLNVDANLDGKVPRDSESDSESTVAATTNDLDAWGSSPKSSSPSWGSALVVAPAQTTTHDLAADVDSKAQLIQDMGFVVARSDAKDLVIKHGGRMDLAVRELVAKQQNY